jgi:hypothetical protein
MIVVVAQNRLRPVFDDEDARADPANWLRDLRIPTASLDPYDKVLNKYVSDGNAPATLQFKRFSAQFVLGSNGSADRVRFIADSSTPDMTTPVIDHSAVPSNYWPVASGCFVIVADAGGGSPSTVKDVAAADSEPTTNYNARANGRVFRLGAEVTGQTYPTFELVPGQDLQSIPKRALVTNANSVIQDDSGVDRPPFFTSAPSDTNTGRVEVLILGRALQDPVKPFDKNSNPYAGPPMDVAVYSSVIGVKP